MFDAAWSRVRRKRRVAWFEVFAGEKAFNAFKEWPPGDTSRYPDFRVAIRAADDLRGRRYSLAERGAAADSGLYLASGPAAILRAFLRRCASRKK